MQIFVIADPLFLIFCSLLSVLSQIFCKKHDKIVVGFYAATYFKRIFNIRNKDRGQKMLDLGNFNFKTWITKV